MVFSSYYATTIHFVVDSQRSHSRGGLCYQGYICIDHADDAIGEWKSSCNEVMRPFVERGRRGAT